MILDGKYTIIDKEIYVVYNLLVQILCGLSSFGLYMEIHETATNEIILYTCGAVHKCACTV